MPRTFKEYINETKNPYAQELEIYLFKLKPKKFMKIVDNIKDKAWYWAERENLVAYEDQNGIRDSYTQGSLYELLRNYRYGSEMMSSKMKEYIDKELPLDDMKLPNLDEEFDLGNGLFFVVKSKQKTIPNMLINHKYNDIRFADQDEFRKKFEYLFDMTIEDRENNKTYKFSWNKYQTRTKISPESIIPKRTLILDMYKAYQDTFDEALYFVKYRELVTLAMVDEVIGKHYIKDNRAIIEEIKSELRKAKKPSEAAEVLNRFDFSNIPNEDILADLIRSEDFSATYSQPDNWGHTSGITYRINFQTRTIDSQGWSSDD